MVNQARTVCMMTRDKNFITIYCSTFHFHQACWCWSSQLLVNNLLTTALLTGAGLLRRAVLSTVLSSRPLLTTCSSACQCDKHQRCFPIYLSCHFYFCNVFGLFWPILTIFFNVAMTNDLWTYLHLNCIADLYKVPAETVLHCSYFVVTREMLLWYIFWVIALLFFTACKMKSTVGIY